MKARILLAAALMFTIPVHAEFMGAVDGRAADLSTISDLSVEVNANTMDINGAKFTWNGLRLNYKVNEEMMVFADVIQLNLKEFPLGSLKVKYAGNGFGAGVIYQVPDLLDGYKTSFKGNFYTSDLDDKENISVNGNPVETTIKLSGMSAKMLISPEEPLSNGAMWYASVGYATIESELNFGPTIKADGTGVTAAVGLVMPLSVGEVFGGYESIDGEGQIGGGFRYAFN